MEDNYFDLIVEKAADIERSGRWSAFNEHIITLHQSCKEEERWQVVVLSHIAASVFHEFIQLRKAYREKDNDAALIAWRARNLLELGIWSVYISQSAENAKKFEEDAARDVLDITDYYIKWGAETAQDEEWIKKLKDTKEDIKQKAQARNVEDLEKSYQRVQEAAKSLGMEKHYKIANKQLSKHAHPTAMHILGPLDNKEAMQKLKTLFWEEGCSYFVYAFESLESLLKVLRKHGF